MDQQELDARIESQKARLEERDRQAAANQPKPLTVHEVCAREGHTWGTAYKSSSERKVCVRCGEVTDPPFWNRLGVAESGRRKATP